MAPVKQWLCLPGLILFLATVMKVPFMGPPVSGPQFRKDVIYRKLPVPLTRPSFREVGAYAGSQRTPARSAGLRVRGSPGLGSAIPGTPSHPHPAA